MKKYGLYTVCILMFICLNSKIDVLANEQMQEMQEIVENASNADETKNLNTIYIGSITTGTSSGDGLTPETATSDLEKALRIVPEGGIIQLVPGTISSYTGRVFINKNITFRGTTGDEDITFRYGINMNANLTIENLSLRIGSGVALEDLYRGKIFVNGNTLNIGDNVKTIYTTGTGTNYNLAGIIYAGSENKDVPKGKKSIINIKSGNFAKIVMTGGSFNYLDVGIVAQPANMYGDVEVNISGGAIGDMGTGGIYSYSNNLNQQGNEYLGNTQINVNGPGIKIGEIKFGANKGVHRVNLNTTGRINAKGFYNIDELIINGPIIDLSDRNALAGTKNVSLMPGSVLNVNLLYSDLVIDGDFTGGGHIYIKEGGIYNIKINGQVFNKTTVDSYIIDVNIIETSADIAGEFVASDTKKEITKKISNGRAIHRITHKKSTAHDIFIADGIIGGQVEYEIDTDSPPINFVYVRMIADPGYRFKSIKVLLEDGTEHDVMKTTDGRHAYIMPNSDTTIYVTFELDGSPLGINPATSLRWERNIAAFNPSDEAIEYEVVLYKNNNILKTIKTNDVIIDFDDEVIKFGAETENTYRFTVKALAPLNSSKVDSKVVSSPGYIFLKPANNISIKVLNPNIKEHIGFYVFKTENGENTQVNSSLNTITNGELLYGLHNGEYIIELYSKGALRYKTEIITLENEIANKVINIELMMGDNDANDSIDAFDRSILVQNLSKTIDDTNRYLDYNGDNGISSLDLGILLINIGKHS